MMKKSGAIAALTVALLAMAVQVTQSCQLPETDSESKTGNVRLIFGDNTDEGTDARTILPKDPTFVKYELDFVHSVNGAIATKTITSATIAAITLVPGNYTLTVTGYKDDPDDPGNNELPVAVATTATNGGISAGTNDLGGGTGFKVDINATTTLVVQLKPFTLGTGTGTLSWDIDLSTITTANNAQLTIRNRAAGGTPGAIVGSAEDLLVDEIGDRSLASGQYYVYVNITTSPNSGSIIFYDVVHIYQNLESELAREFTTAHLYATDGSAAGGITYISPPEGPFDLGIDSIPPQATAVDGSEDHPIVISLGADTSFPSSVSLSLADAATLFTGGYTWTSYGSPLGPANTSLTVSIANDPFKTAGPRPITLEAKTATQSYTMVINVSVVP
jgi:hypothetical protein